MNREIKFRAWLKNVGIMLHVYVLDQTGDAGKGTHFPTSKGYSEHGGQFVFNIDEAELMQFTGFKDRDGKEIYEGDIISWKYEYDSDYDGDMPIVKTSEGKAVVKDIFDTYNIRRAKEEGKGCKVIGDIYTTPELL